MAIGDLVSNALLAISGAGVAGITAQVFLSYMSQRAQNDITSQGMQAVVGTNTISTVDRSQDNGRLAARENGEQTADNGQ